jgi:hypothetical protein
VTSSLVNAADPLERQNAKLLKVTEALMRRVEAATDEGGAAYAHFQRALMLEEQVRERTRDLEASLDLLNVSNARLASAMEAAERARADLFDALEAVQEGFALFDADDVLVMCNSRFGMALPDVQPKLRPGLGFVDYVRLVARSPHLTLGGGQTQVGWMRERLANHRRQSVSFNVQIGEDRWIQVSEQRTPGGGTAILQTDITALVQMERQERDKLLDEQARLIRATLDHINQGIVIFDDRERLVGWNARLVALLSPPMQLLRVGMPFARLAEHFRTRLLGTGAIGPHWLARWVENPTLRPPLAFELTTRDGVYLDIFAQEMPDRGFVISFTDVTAEREATRAMHAANERLEARVQERTLALEAALAEAERANASKSRFVAAASHDLLQPLSAAKLFLASIENADCAAEQHAILGRVRSAFESVEAILGALLDISKLDSGRVAVRLADVPLGGLFARLEAEFGEMARQAGLDLRVVPSRLAVRSDSGYLRRIVQNLLANAIRYTPSGRVLVGARRVGGAARIEVWDTGPGIPEEARGTIFHEFQRLETPGRADGGVGLGLAIVERACKLLDHPLTLASEVGRGTVFRVTAPLAAGAAACACAAAAAEPGEGGPLAALIALVIENDAALRLATTTLLEGWGASVLDAPSGEAAMALLDDIGIAPDVTLADYHLDGDRSGVDAILALRARHGEHPACLVTADRGDALAARCRGLGIALFNKPVEPARLRAFLGAAAASADAARRGGLPMSRPTPATRAGADGG